jgi:hypothetical protein
MAATVSGSKTVTQTLSPNLTHTQLSALLAIAPENYTVAQWKTIWDAISRVPGGGAPGNTIGSLLK